jgi:hypothetical protein
MKLEFSQQIFAKSSDIKFNQNPFSGSRVVPHGQTDRQTDVMKLTVAFHNFVNHSKSGYHSDRIEAVYYIDTESGIPINWFH